MLEPITTKNPMSRAALLKRRARQFRDTCRRDNMAYKIPDPFFDSITDQELEIFKAHLRGFGMRQRADFFWEPA